MCKDKSQEVFFEIKLTLFKDSYSNNKSTFFINVEKWRISFFNDWFFVKLRKLGERFLDDDNLAN